VAVYLAISPQYESASDFLLAACNRSVVLHP
jgi:hypothetical protein